jgi:hypothetical protein
LFFYQIHKRQFQPQFHKPFIIYTHIHTYVLGERLLTTTTTTTKGGINVLIIKRNRDIGDVKKIQERLNIEEGLKNLRYLKRGKSLINAMQMTEFRSYIDFSEPLLYVSPLPVHDAPFVLQSDRIVVRAENEKRANELLDVFISKHRI